MSTGSTSKPRKQRADAQHNREQIVTQTATLFAQRGPDVPMEEIAEHAGLGVGTLYRHFPDRAALTLAVSLYVHERIAELLQRSYSGHRDPWQALTSMIRGWVTLRLGVRAPLDPWLTEPRSASPRLRELHELCVTIMDRTVAEAHAAGSLRPDMHRLDIVRLVGLLILVEENAELLTEVVIDGLRARPS